jgi:uncharacterized protein (DUF1501 family)
MSNHDDRYETTAADRRVAGAACEGCPESRLLMSRRSMMGVSAALFSSAFLPDFAFAETDPQARLFVVILRGGMDGIGMVIPKLDSHYQEMRRELALPFSSTLSLGSDFALHPGMSRLHRMFGDRDATIIPAAGIPLRNRSHFECQDNLENGLPVNISNATGWLNRMLGALPKGDPIRTHMGIEIGDAPVILRGPEPVLGWSPTWFEKSNPATIANLESAYKKIDMELWSSLSRGLAADALALNSGADPEGDISSLRRGFIGAARLMRASSGPRIAVLSVDGYDTHADQGGVTGQFNDRLTELDMALNDLKTEMGPAWEKTVAICVTEFGRTVRTNGDSGTDHGVATAGILAGGALKGGIVGDWPGIAQAQLYEDSALTPTVDLRSIFKGVLRDHLGVPIEILNTTVFPDSAAAKATPNLIRGTSSRQRPVSDFVRPPTLQETAPVLQYRRKYGVDAALSL